MGSEADAALDERGLLAAVTEAAFGIGVFVFRGEPEADGNLRAKKELAEDDHVFLRCAQFEVDGGGRLGAARVGLAG